MREKVGVNDNNGIRLNGMFEGQMDMCKTVQRGEGERKGKSNTKEDIHGG